MKRKYCIFGSIVLILIAFYYVDRNVFMKERVLRHEMWDYESGAIIRKHGAFFTDMIVLFNRDTMVFDWGKQGKDTLILKYQYFSIMKVMDPKTGKTGKYSMKGANWTDYLFKKRMKRQKRNG